MCQEIKTLPSFAFSQQQPAGIRKRPVASRLRNPPLLLFIQVQTALLNTVRTQIITACQHK